MYHIYEDSDVKRENILNCPSKWSEPPNIYTDSGSEIINMPYREYKTIDVFKILCIVCLYTAVVVLIKAFYKSV